MKIVNNANEAVLAILKKFKQTDSGSRMVHYCVEQQTEDGILLFNLLTREMVLLTKEEYDNRMELDYLKDRWFVVPNTHNDKEVADLVKWFLTNRQKKSKEITAYTIFPTTDCNARCFYCFELGRSRIPMSQETAARVAEYIKAHCGEKKVHISWFGGEPLFNQSVVDTICNGLRNDGIEFASSMTSNGYLFDNSTVQKAVENWNLNQVQITLDGTEKTYNKTKAFIYREGSPYQVVLGNIGRLLDAGIAVQIRLNMDMYNAEDLLTLVDELAERFSDRKGLSVYAHHIFDGDRPMAEQYTDEEWEKRDDAMRRLNDKIMCNSLATKRGVSKNFKLNYCKADSGNAVTILPDGSIGLCEHFSESEFIGHIDSETFDAEMVASWKERMPEISECAECFFYPECIKLKKCTSGSICFRQLRQDQLRKTKQQMLNEYEKWMANIETDDTDEPDEC